MFLDFVVKEFVELGGSDQTSHDTVIDKDLTLQSEGPSVAYLCSQQGYQTPEELLDTFILRQLLLHYKEVIQSLHDLFHPVPHV